MTHALDLIRTRFLRGRAGSPDRRITRAASRFRVRWCPFVLALALAFTGLYPVSRSWAEPPRITIVSPTKGASVGGVVSIKALVHGGAQSVVFQWSQDRGATWQPIGIDADASAGWTTSWDTTALRGVTWIRATAIKGIELGSDRTWVRVRGIPPPDPEPPSLSSGLAAYAGFGTWVDVPSEDAWEKPWKTVHKMAKMGVQTLFLQTSNYRHDEAIVYRRAAKKILTEAHDRGIRVVAWYLPALNRPKQDFNRVKEAIDLQGSDGDRFDSFALDIEATVIENIEKRNRNTVRLAKRIRAYVGDNYSLGAIVPDPVHSTYWPDFPYKPVAEQFDVFLPMSYFTYRTSGYANVRRYVEANVRAIQRRTGNENVFIHVIGGLAGIASNREVEGHLDACFAREVEGSSLYDFSITEREEWQRMRRARELDQENSGQPEGSSSQASDMPFPEAE